MFMKMFLGRSLLQMSRSYLKVWMSEFFEGLVPYNLCGLVIVSQPDNQLRYFGRIGGSNASRNIFRVRPEARPLIPRSWSESLLIQSTITLQRF